MIKKYSLTLDDDFQEYCRINGISDYEKLARKIFNRGFAIEKYGETPKGIKSNDKVIEKEVIKEVIVEKIVEVIKEVPVEKEVIVNKTIEDGRVEGLLKENESLKAELKKITDSLEKMNRATFMKNSDLNSLYGE